MRFLRYFASPTNICLGVRQGEQVVNISLAAARIWNQQVTSPLFFIAAGAGGTEKLRDLLDCVRGDADLSRDCIRPAAGWRLDAPLRDAPKLLALAGNFRKHVEESGLSAIEQDAVITPQVFCKPVSTAINAPGAPVVIRRSNVFLDWEAELAVVIGRRGRNISADEAHDYVFGYTIINDISERAFNRGVANRKVREYDPFFDWLIGKWFDGSAPLGPELVTADEISDPHNLRIRLWVNDQLMQDASTSQMIHRIPRVIAYVSQVLTLEPGDILAMGTPEGVGKARGICLKDEDRVRCEIEGLGTLENPVVSEG